MSLLTPTSNVKKDSYIGIRVPQSLKDQFVEYIETVGSGLTINAALIQLMERALDVAEKEKAAVTKPVAKKKKGARK